MSRVLRPRRGNSAQHSTFIGQAGELTVDIERRSVVVHDGTTPGGYDLKRELADGTGVVAGVSASRLSNTVIQVPHLKALPTTDLVDGQQYSVAGYYDGSNLGGGTFVYNASRSWSDHNGGTVIAPPAIAAWDGTPATLAAFLNFTPTAGSGCWELVNVADLAPEEFGAVPNTISTIAINAAASAAKSINAKIVFNNPLSYDQNINIYTDAEFNAPLTRVGAASAVVFIEPLESPDTLTIDPALIANFTKGSKSTGITGLNVGDVLVFESTEVLTKRFGFETPYFKKDVFIVTSEDGQVSPAFSTSYTDITKLTVTKHNSPERTSVKNLHLKNNSTNDTVTMCLVRRSNVNLIGFQINNTSVTNGDTGVTVSNAAKVDFTGGEVSGFFKVGTGYGVNLQNSCFVTLDNFRGFNSRRPLSGRNTKETFVNGGIYESAVGGAGPLDTHWGVGFYVNKAHLYCNGASAVSFAGENVSVKNCILYQPTSVIQVRPDTPDLGGVVEEVDNIIYQHPTLTFAMLNYFSVDYGGFFERVIDSPALLSIKNNNLSLTGSNHSCILAFSDYVYPQKAIGKIDIDSNNPFGTKTSVFSIVRRVTGGELKLHDGLVGITDKILISNQYSDVVLSSDASGVAALRVLNMSTTPKIRKITVNNCENFGVKISPDACERFVINSTDVKWQDGFAFGPDKVPSFNYEINNCKLSGWYQRAANTAKLKSCEIADGFVVQFNNTVSSSQVLFPDAKQLALVSMGCFAHATVPEGSIPQLDGFALNTSNFIVRTALPRRTGSDFTNITLPYTNIGLREDTRELQVWVGGALRKVALT